MQLHLMGNALLKNICLEVMHSRVVPVMWPLTAETASLQSRFSVERFLAVSAVEGRITGTTLRDNSRMHNRCSFFNSLSSDDFEKTFTKCQDRMRSCLTVQGAYFEKDVRTLNFIDDSK